MKNYRFFFQDHPDFGDADLVLLKNSRSNRLEKFTYLFNSIGLRRMVTLKKVLEELCKYDHNCDLEFLPDGDPESAFIVHIGTNGDHIHFWRGRRRRACAMIRGVDYHDISWLKALKILIRHVNDVAYEVYEQELLDEADECERQWDRTDR